MPLFDRIMSVTIGETGSTGTLIEGPTREREGIDMRFQIEKHAEGPPNQGRCEIMNLTETTRSRFKAGRDTMIIRAGYYEDDEGPLLCCALDVIDVRVEKKGSDVVTIVAGGDGLHPLRNKRLSVSYRGGRSVKEILVDVVKSLGVAFQDPAMSDVPDATYQNGFSEGGTATDILDRLTGRMGAKWSFQDGQLQVAPRDAPVSSTIVVLNQDTGLIGKPLKRNKVESVYVPIVRPGWIVRSLLNPRIVPNGKVRLQSQGVNAVYRVLKVSHTGETRGPAFFTEADIAEW